MAIGETAKKSLKILKIIVTNQKALSCNSFFL
jgi:hypothetical protein